MNALQEMDRYLKEMIEVSIQKNDIKVHYLHDSILLAIVIFKLRSTKNFFFQKLLLYDTEATKSEQNQSTNLNTKHELFKAGFKTA